MEFSWSVNTKINHLQEIPSDTLLALMPAVVTEGGKGCSICRGYSKFVYICCDLSILNYITGISCYIYVQVYVMAALS